MKVTRISNITGVEHTMELDITQEQVDRFNVGGELIQQVFPNLTKAEREFIMTGITQEEWDKIFPPGENDA